MTHLNIFRVIEFGAVIGGLIIVLITKQYEPGTFLIVVGIYARMLAGEEDMKYQLQSIKNSGFGGVIMMPKDEEEKK